MIALATCRKTVTVEVTRALDTHTFMTFSSAYKAIVSCNLGVDINASVDCNYLYIDQARLLFLKKTYAEPKETLNNYD